MIADLHIGHRSIVQFVREDGTPARPEWGRCCPNKDMPDDEVAERVEAMNEAMVERWNAVVGPKDKVEVLGDVVFGRRNLSILGRLNGKKRLSGKGNHDQFDLKDFLPYFEDIHGCKPYTLKGHPDLILSHIPLHPEMVAERWTANVHGHLHHRRVMKPNPEYDHWLRYGTSGDPVPYRSIPDPLYLCVSVEHTEYAPLHVDEVYRRIRDQQEGGINA